ncbi:MAG: ATP-binding protein, partial [Armatimonadetes bacterium]|nr:ATP-binding protein [Armatimonadota bacterium]
RVPGDPGPLTQALSNLIGNALDAIAERAQAETEGYHGLIAVSVTTEAGVTQIKVADNGCGAEAALLQRLRQGESLSTKGKDRGVGLPAVRRTLSRYPLGNLALDSLGRGEGCVATVSFEEL